eukprot:9977618-Alexandrium_andersonii.AAC.1
MLQRALRSFRGLVPAGWGSAHCGLPTWRVLGFGPGPPAPRAPAQEGVGGIICGSGWWLSRAWLLCLDFPTCWQRAGG